MCHRCRSRAATVPRVLRLLCALVPAAVLSGFMFLLVTGDYINDGQVVVGLGGGHGVHEGDLFVVAGWLVSLLALTVLLARPRGRGHR